MESKLTARERDKRKQRHGVKKKGSIGDNGEIREEEEMMKEEGKEERKGDTGDKEVVEISPNEFLVTSIISDRTPEGGGTIPNEIASRSTKTPCRGLGPRRQL